MTILKLEITDLPNQVITLTTSDSTYELHFYLGKENLIFCDIKRDSEEVINGALVLANTPIIQYKSLLTNGNFYISTPAEEDKIDYREFGKTQFLYFGFEND